MTSQGGRADSELQRIRQRLESVEELLERAELGVLVAEVDTHRFRFANRRMCEMLGYERDELLALQVADLHPPDRLHEVERAFADQAARKLGTAMGLPVRRKDGTIFAADISSSPVVFEGVACLIGMFRDAADRVALTTELSATTQLLETLLDAIPDVIGLQDHKHGVLRYNRAGYAFLGLEPSDLPGKKCYQLIGNVKPCEVCATSEAYHTRRPAQVRKYVEEMDLWLDARSYPILDEAGRVVQVVEHLRDITAEVRTADQLRENEAQMRQMQKMEAIGNLAGGVAHDFNNLLTAILGFTGLIANDDSASEKVRGAASMIERAATRAAELTQQLLGFARRGKLREEPIDIHAIIDETVGLLEHTIDRRIVVQRSLVDGRPRVPGDASQLRQVMLNLAVNARDAMPDGGELRFTTRLTDDPEGLGTVIVEVTDSGSGIPPDDLERIFEPFFTTKGDSQGTGMGLAMVYGIVANHQGSIDVESEVGRGTTFRLTFPRTVRRAVGERAADAPVSGQGRVLVIDDEALVRRVARQMLETLGYEVITADDGVAGEAVFREQHAAIDLVIIDLIMPEVGGRECFQRLKAIAPDVRALLSSGYSEEDEIRALLDGGVAGFIGKPYRLSELSRAVANALSGG